ncbi:MAG: pectate lyase [Ignavibacteriales bacterium]|nr:pectate lyase [Ignavibacteriales bacterium]
MIQRICLMLLILLFGLCGAAQAQSIKWNDCLHQKKDWYGTAEAARIAENVVMYQGTSGGWPKNIDMARKLEPREKARLQAAKGETESTIDNTATYTQLRFLAKVYNATHDERWKRAFMEGFDFLLAAQYENGGWPQFFPLRKGYYTHITYNDEAMAEVLNLFQDVVDRSKQFLFVDAERRARAEKAITKGIECILRCQIVNRDTLTAWCAQHDEVTFAPAKARAYELPSLSGKESVGVVRFLMRIKNPPPTIIASINGAVAWLQRVQVKGFRVESRPDTLSPTGMDKIVVPDPAAPSLWARFYEIGTDRPIYVSRDGIVRYDLSEISYERRNHYGWLDTWPEGLLTKEFPAWKKKHGL